MNTIGNLSTCIFNLPIDHFRAYSLPLANTLATMNNFMAVTPEEHAPLFTLIGPLIKSLDGLGLMGTVKSALSRKGGSQHKFTNRDHLITDLSIRAQNPLFLKTFKNALAKNVRGNLGDMLSQLATDIGAKKTTVPYFRPLNKTRGNSPRGELIHPSLEAESINAAVDYGFLSVSAAIAFKEAIARNIESNISFLEEEIRITDTMTLSERRSDDFLYHSPDGVLYRSDLFMIVCAQRALLSGYYRIRSSDPTAVLNRDAGSLLAFAPGTRYKKRLRSNLAEVAKPLSGRVIGLPDYRSRAYCDHTGLFVADAQLDAGK